MAKNGPPRGEEIQNLISKGNTREALNVLTHWAQDSENKRILEEISGQSGIFNNNERDKRRKVISNEEYLTTREQVVNAIFAIMNELEEEVSRRPNYIHQVAEKPSDSNKTPASSSPKTDGQSTIPKTKTQKPKYSLTTKAVAIGVILLVACLIYFLSKKAINDTSIPPPDDIPTDTIVELPEAEKRLLALGNNLNIYLADHKNELVKAEILAAVHDTAKVFVNDPSNDEIEIVPIQVYLGLLMAAEIDSIILHKRSLGYYEQNAFTTIEVIEERTAKTISND